MTHGVTHFETHARDPGGLPGLHRDRWSVATGEGHGIDRGAIRREGPPFSGTPVTGATRTVNAGDIGAAGARIVGARHREVAPRSPVPGVGRTAHYRDLDGNVFGLFQRDAEAR